MGIGDTGFSFQTPGEATSVSASNPGWYQANIAAIQQGAADIYGQNLNFTPYGKKWVNGQLENDPNYSGQVIAPTNAMQQSAQTGAQNLMGGLANYGQNIQQFMNPYQASVNDQIARMGQRNLNENVMPAVTSNFGNAGQFGSKRMMDFQGRALRDNAETMQNATSQAAQQGWQQANQAQNANFTQNMAGLGQLNQFGGDEWNRSQQQNQFNLQQWNAQQQYPFQQMNWLSGVSRGLQPGQVGGIQYQYGGSQGTAPNYLQTLGGLAQTSYALGGGR